MFTLNCRGKILLLESPLIMGVLNINDDSFYTGSRFQQAESILKKAEQMVLEGATILDIGGQSTRPASERIHVDEEMHRVLPVIKMLTEKLPQNIFLSIDTYHSAVAKACVDAGVSMVNDISGGAMDAEMMNTVATLNVPYTCMHLKGVPETMHLNIQYENVVNEVLDFFIEKIDECKRAGIKDVIIDPGFGFGKNHQHNFQLLQHLAVFKMLVKPIMVGVSRKSTIYKTLGITADEALNGTTVLNTIALLNGAAILRVHDVKEAKEAITLLETYGKA